MEDPKSGKTARALSRDQPIKDLLDEYISQAKHNLSHANVGDVLDSLQVLRGKIDWKDVSDLPADPPLPEGTRVWTATVEDWSLILLEFPLTHMGRPNEIGHNVAMTNTKKSLSLVSDGNQQHELAAWLRERMKKGQ